MTIKCINYTLEEWIQNVLVFTKVTLDFCKFPRHCVQDYHREAITTSNKLKLCYAVNRAWWRLHPISSSIIREALPSFFSNYSHFFSLQNFETLQVGLCVFLKESPFFEWPIVNGLNLVSMCSQSDREFMVQRFFSWNQTEAWSSCDVILE